MSQASPVLLRACVALGCCCLLLAAGAAAADGGESPSQDGASAPVRDAEPAADASPTASDAEVKPPEAPLPAAASGLRVFVNPQTGQVVGAPPPGVEPPGLSVAEQQMLDRSVEGLQAQQLANGAVVVNLQGRFMSMALATVGAGASPSVECTETASGAEASLSDREDARRATASGPSSEEGNDAR